MIALVHPLHGTHFVYDQDAKAEHLKLGWSVRPDNWKELKAEAERQRKVAGLKAEQERIAKELAAVETPERKKPGPKPKVK
jgi:hypothetical protein